MAHQIKKNLGVTMRGGSAEFRLWAPFAKSVSISGTFTPNCPIELDSEHDGYWSKTIDDVEPGHTYKYGITTANGVLWKNDPRALAITSSDKGLSVIVDDTFDWEDDRFASIPREQQIIYELHIGTFNRPDAATPGTFDTAIEKLDYLKELGINMIELMPITSMAYSFGWGYAPNYIYSVEAMLGGRHGLMKFVREAHKRGIGVILDVVYNHFAGDTDLWQFDGWNESNRGGIYFYNDYRGDTPWGGRPDYGRPEVRQFILDNITMWLTDYHIDGLRIDSTIYMRNTEGFANDPAHDLPEAWLLLQDINTLAHKINPQITTIAEDFSCTDYITKSREQNGAGFNSQWELGFPHAIRNALGVTYGYPRTLSDLNHELQQQYNDDVFQRVIFSDSHDTAANGSARLNEIITPRDPTSQAARQTLLIASTLMLTAAGIPMLLQGSEFLQDGAFNDWQALEWEKSEKYCDIVLAHRHLIDLRLNRHGNAAGLQGQHTAIFHQNDNDGVLGYHRWKNGGAKDDVIVIINFSPNVFDSYELWLPRAGTWQVRFNSVWDGYSKDFSNTKIETISTDERKIATITLPSYVVLIASQDE